MEKVAVMNENLELDRLAKENDNFKKIIQTQQNTINRMIDYFILGEKKAGRCYNKHTENYLLQHMISRRIKPCSNLQMTA